MQSEKEMGSLAQAARGNQLNTAKWIMIVVGILSMAVNGGMLFVADKSINEEISQLRAQGFEVADVDIAAARLQNTLVFGAGVILGVIFAVLGVLVHKFPVPCTVAGLVLYVGSAIVFGILDPTTLLKGVIIKVFIVFGLAKSVQSAAAFEADAKTKGTLAQDDRQDDV
ncbi:MAG: hypothetical protein Aurels2KO_14550 [Aureliella sp.]